MTPIPANMPIASSGLKNNHADATVTVDKAKAIMSANRNTAKPTIDERRLPINGSHVSSYKIGEKRK